MLNSILAGIISLNIVCGPKPPQVLTEQQMNPATEVWLDPAYANVVCTRFLGDPRNKGYKRWWACSVRPFVYLPLLPAYKERQQCRQHEHYHRLYDWHHGR